MIVEASYQPNHHRHGRTPLQPSLLSDPCPRRLTSPKGHAISFDDSGSLCRLCRHLPCGKHHPCRHLPCGKHHPCRHLLRGKRHRKRRGDRSRHNIPSRREDRGHIRKSAHIRHSIPRLRHTTGRGDDRHRRDRRHHDRRRRDRPHDRGTPRLGGRHGLGTRLHPRMPPLRATVVTDESGLDPCANIKCGCTTGVMAWDGCEMKSAAVIVTASAVNLIRMLISNSLHTPGDTSVLHSHLDALAQTKNQKTSKHQIICWACRS